MPGAPATSTPTVIPRPAPIDRVTPTTDGGAFVVDMILASTPSPLPRSRAGQRRTARSGSLTEATTAAVVALLDLAEATGDDQHLELVHAPARALAAESVDELDDGSGLAWPVRARLPTSAPFWCHSAAGVGGLLLRLAPTVPGAAQIAARAAITTGSAARPTGPTQCHGLAGAVEFLLDAHQATGDPGLLGKAQLLGDPAARLLVRAPRPAGLELRQSGAEDPPPRRAAMSRLPRSAPARGCRLRLLDIVEIADAADDVQGLGMGACVRVGN